MKIIPVGDAEIYVDDEDFERLSTFKWKLWQNRTPCRLQRFRGKRLVIPVAWDIIGCPPIGLEVDHKDRNPFNNRRSNLRFCTHAQNMLNRGTWNKHGRKGVQKHRSRYQASIRLNGKKTHLGTFETVEAAGNAYVEAAKRLHGEFAGL